MSMIMTLGGKHNRVNTTLLLRLVVCQLGDGKSQCKRGVLVNSQQITTEKKHLAVGMKKKRESERERGREQKTE